MSEPTKSVARNESTGPSGVPAALLVILVCPVDHAALGEETGALVCRACGRRYPVERGIPNFVFDE